MKGKDLCAHGVKERGAMAESPLPTQRRDTPEPPVRAGVFRVKEIERRLYTGRKQGGTAKEISSHANAWAFLFWPPQYVTNLTERMN